MEKKLKYKQDKKSRLKTFERTAKTDIKKSKLLPRSIVVMDKLDKNSQELMDIEEDCHINPLPTPCFIHLQACDISTPVIKFIPFLQPRLHRAYMTL